MHNANYQTNSQRGLTLLEVLIVLAVLAFLAATFLPALSKAGNQRWVMCISNLKQVDLAEWADGIHYRDKRFFGKEFMGHIAFADGSVRRLGQTELGKFVRVSYPATNRVVIP